MSAPNDRPRRIRRYTNRLAGESSPYLLLHRHNPVDWYPWGEEALARAREEGKPIFLSVGYSTCYWCHVMERESFSNPEVARVMNERFVNVKVDREERPDLDETYMAATQILAGQGGWPNSVFLTPELKPFYAGTYFPPTDAHGRPGFPQVLAGLAGAWKDRREDVYVQADEVAQAMRRILEERFAPGERVPEAGAAERACEGLRHTFDREHGGFGRSPKFPTPSNLYLLHALAVRADERAQGDPSAGEMLARTLDRMARGGIYDQLGGGFHRYSTDAEWLVPHFEKMLYDNGALLELYALEHRRTGSPQAERIVRETAAFLEREMTLPDGAFASAIDAETDGREGAFYVWTAAELHEILGEEDFAFLAPLYGFDREPVLPRSPRARGRARLRAAPAGAAGRAGGPAADRRSGAARGDRAAPPEAVRGALPAPPAADRRQGPGRLERPGDPGPGHRRPGAGRRRHDRPGAPCRRPGDRGDAPRGRAAAPRGARRRGADPGLSVRLRLPGPRPARAARGDRRARYLDAAIELAAEQEERLAAPHGGFYNAAASDDLLFRSQEIFDGATPAANAVAVLNALELAERGALAGAGERAARWRRRPSTPSPPSRRWSSARRRRCGCCRSPRCGSTRRSGPSRACRGRGGPRPPHARRGIGPRGGAAAGEWSSVRRRLRRGGSTSAAGGGG